MCEGRLNNGAPVHNLFCQLLDKVGGRSSWKTDGATEAIDGQLLTGTGQPVSLDDGIQEVIAGVTSFFGSLLTAMRLIWVRKECPTVVS